MNILYKSDEEEEKINPFSVYERQVHSVLFYFLTNLPEEISLRNIPPTYMLIKDYGEETHLHEGEEFNVMSTTPPSPIDDDLFEDVSFWREFLMNKMNEINGVGFCLWLYIYNSLDEEFIFTILYKKGSMIQGHLIPLPLDKKDVPKNVSIEDVLPDFEMTFEDDILIS